jgi:hypothetical protein
MPSRDGWRVSHPDCGLVGLSCGNQLKCKLAKTTSNDSAEFSAGYPTPNLFTGQTCAESGGPEDAAQEADADVWSREEQFRPRRSALRKTWTGKDLSLETNINGLSATDAANKLPPNGVGTGANQEYLFLTAMLTVDDCLSMLRFVHHMRILAPRWADRILLIAK